MHKKKHTTASSGLITCGTLRVGVLAGPQFDGDDMVIPLAIRPRSLPLSQLYTNRNRATPTLSGGLLHLFPLSIKSVIGYREREGESTEGDSAKMILDAPTLTVSII